MRNERAYDNDGRRIHGTNLLTDAQSALLEYAMEHILEHGSSPTIEDIKIRFGFKANHGVERHVLALQKKGYIVRTGNRGFKVIRDLERRSVCLSWRFCDDADASDGQIVFPTSSHT